MFIIPHFFYEKGIQRLSKAHLDYWKEQGQADMRHLLEHEKKVICTSIHDGGTAKTIDMESPALQVDSKGVQMLAFRTDLYWESSDVKQGHTQLVLYTDPADHHLIKAELLSTNGRVKPGWEAVLPEYLENARRREHEAREFVLAWLRTMGSSDGTRALDHLGISRDNVVKALQMPLPIKDSYGVTQDGNTEVFFAGSDNNLSMLKITQRTRVNYREDAAVTDPFFEFVATAISKEAAIWIVEQGNFFLRQTSGKQVTQKLFGSKLLEVTLFYTEDKERPVRLQLLISGFDGRPPYPK